MRQILACVVAAVLACAASASAAAQAGSAAVAAEPFKLGTFEIDGRARVGIVLRDSLVVDVEAANQALQWDPAYPTLSMPADMRALIDRYEYGLKYRLYEIVTDLVTTNRLEAGRRPGFVHDVTQVRTLAPIRYPGKLLMAAVNYFGHVSEGLPAEEQRKAAEARRRDRGHPYLFLKPTVGAIIGNGDAVVLPYARDRIDWEVELGIVIGRAAKYVPAPQAADHIFGYTIVLDMSDRGGRPGGGSDWFVGKGHDTFAPMGPWIVPKEFYGDPMDVRQTLTVSGDPRQDHRSSDMIHDIYELIEYGSSIMTLFPGDVIGAGSGRGVGSGIAVRGEQLFLNPNEEIVATIEGIGTLVHPVVAEPARPDDTGSFLPPVAR